MANIVFINTDNLDTDNDESVEVHAPNCRHLARHRGNPFFEVGEPEEWDSAQAFFDDYNEAFIAEDGPDGAWDIRFLPCSGLVSKSTVITA
ncbi:hypothetical protein [Brevibacterium spongiae]|uniref:Uncharacterized protein n=1 Tax=Brevibacterium spongiae TaxID=2909672 RepID=A0ABY5STX4_9MICO|nr:hypothetical protein [Brevibacterium spongiae]UVI38040.1 hypothetical protein L1F31_18825 [Brevibacterium spongiae]